MASPSPTPTPAGGTPTAGQTVGDFRIVRRLGQGGMGQVFLAEQLSLKRKVALKFLRADLVANPSALGRFRAEAEAVAKINHANIVQVYTLGEHAGQQFMALEYVEGMNLRDYLARKGPLDLPRALIVMRQVAAALQRASEAGVVHRDIKPENILLTRSGEVKVADFGLSRLFGQQDQLNLTQSGTTMGTPLYMSPEQVQGKAVDPRSDIYSFGVTCYHMLAGRPPFSGTNAFDVALKHVNETPPPLGDARPDLPADVVALVHGMLSKDPAQRPQTGRAVLKELKQSAPAALDVDFPDVPVVVTTAEEATAVDALPPSPTAGRWWRLAAAALLATGVGVGVRLGIAPPAAAVRPTVPDPEPGEDERLWADLVRRYATASLSAPATLQSAFQVNVQLAVLLLDQRRFAELREFITRIPDREPAMQFLRNLLDGMLAAFEDRPESALASLKAAFADRNYPRYVALVTIPPTREGIDLRFLVIEALGRVERSIALPPDLQRVRGEMMAGLRRPQPPAAKGAKA
jgi:serine/threonine-protein kinase